jgi:hypothetical protein
MLREDLYDYVSLGQSLGPDWEESVLDWINHSPLTFSEAAKFCLYLSAACTGISERPESQLRSLPDRVKQHLSYTFVVDGFAGPLEQTFVHALRKDNFWLISGTLLDWELELKFTLSQGAPFQTRIIAASIFLLLEKEGLQFIFDKYEKIYLEDKTFYLEDKE